MRSLVLITTLGVLAACAGKPPPEIITRTETVEIPIATPVPCLEEGDAEALRAQRPVNIAEEPQPETLTGIVGALRAKVREWEEAFWPTVDEVVTACSTLPDVPDPVLPDPAPPPG